MVKVLYPINLNPNVLAAISPRSILQIAVLIFDAYVVLSRRTNKRDAQVENLFIRIQTIYNAMSCLR